MKMSFEESWKKTKIEIETMSWDKYFSKEPLTEVIKKAVAESFEKRR